LRQQFIGCYAQTDQTHYFSVMSKEALQEIILNRRSIRGFKKDSVELATIKRIIQIGRSAPSGANLQPGRFTVLTNKPLQDLISVLQEAIDNDTPSTSEYSYFPTPLPDHLLQRKRATGFGLYEALNIDRRDIQARKKQFRSNYRFFNAPIGIVVSIEKNLGKGCFMDLGMALQTIFIATQTENLACCGIGALANYGKRIHKHLELPEEEIVVCGIAIGYNDKTNRVNSFKTSRLDISEYADFRGF